VDLVNHAGESSPSANGEAGIRHLIRVLDSIPRRVEAPHEARWNAGVVALA